MIEQDVLTPWLLFEGPDRGSGRLIHPLEKMKSGTIVLLEKFYRFVSDKIAPFEFYELVDGPIRNHLTTESHHLVEE